MTDAVDFSILAAIPSGPDALLVSKACSNSSISSSEQRSSLSPVFAFYSHKDIWEMYKACFAIVSPISYTRVYKTVITTEVIEAYFAFYHQ